VGVRRLDGKQPGHGRHLGDRGTEASVDEVDGVGLTRDESSGELLRELGSQRSRRSGENSAAVEDPAGLSTSVVFDALATDDRNRRFDVGACPEKPLRKAVKVRIV